MLSLLKRKSVKQKIKKAAPYVLFSVLSLVCFSAFAEGHDLLAGTDADLATTIQGTGKKYLYLTEIVMASIGFIKTRQPSAFLGILALSVGLNVLLKFAGYVV